MAWRFRVVANPPSGLIFVVDGIFPSRTLFHAADGYPRKSHTDKMAQGLRAGTLEAVPASDTERSIAVLLAELAKGRHSAKRIVEKPAKKPAKATVPLVVEGVSAESVGVVQAALGRRGGQKGGAARAKALSPEQRRSSASLAAKTRWRRETERFIEDVKRESKSPEEKG